jgi:hypothetical protein
VTETGDAAWVAALDDLDRRHREPLGVVAGLDEARLDAIVPGKTYPVAVTPHGIVQYSTYRAKQIALRLLKRLVR